MEWSYFDDDDWMDRVQEESPAHKGSAWIRNASLVPDNLEAEEWRHKLGVVSEGSILVAGTKNSGKSTLLQMLRHSVNGTRDVAAYKVPIQTQVLNDMRTLLGAAERNGLLMDVESKALATACINGELTYLEIEKLAAFWAQSSFKEFVRSQCHSGAVLEDNTRYFFDRLTDIAAPDYVPTLEDAFRMRKLENKAVHTGIARWRLNIPDYKAPQRVHRMQFIDVAGDMDKRKYWHRTFGQALLIVFVVSLADFCHVDRYGTNGLDGALEVLRGLKFSAYFPRTRLVLVMSKPDLFRSKSLVDSLGNYYADAPTGIQGCDFAESLSFIVRK